MNRQIGLLGTGYAPFHRATEGVLALAAALETILLAQLTLLLTGAGRGSGAAALLARLNGLLLRPCQTLPAVATLLARHALVGQLLVVVAYGIVLVTLTGAIAWFTRRRAIY